MKHIWTVVCSRSVIDSDTNNVSLQNIIEQLNVMDEPKAEGVLPIELDVVSFWVRADDSVPVIGFSRVLFLSPSGKKLGSSELKIDMTEYERLRARVHFHSLPVSESGIYKFRVQYRKDEDSRWKKASDVPVKVNFSPSTPDNNQEKEN